MEHHYAVFVPHGTKLSEQHIIMGINHYHKNKLFSIHAETDAITKYKKKKEKFRSIDLYVLRIGKSGVFGNSRPCLHCMIRMLRSNIDIKHVYYSTSDGTLVREKFDTMFTTTLNISSAIRHSMKLHELHALKY